MRPLLRRLRLSLVQLEVEQFVMKQIEQIEFGFRRFNGLGECPVVLVDQLQMQGLLDRELAPGRSLVGSNPIGKAVELVQAQGHACFLLLMVAPDSLLRILPQVGLTEIKGACPVPLMINAFAHMSGLLGLFVWRQKATTDAPDTHNA